MNSAIKNRAHMRASKKSVKDGRRTAASGFADVSVFGLGNVAANVAGSNVAA